MLFSTFKSRTIPFIDNAFSEMPQRAIFLVVRLSHLYRYIIHLLFVEMNKTRRIL